LAGVVVFVVVVFLKHLEKADIRNEKFICDQQDANNLVIKNLTDEIKTIGEKIAALHTAMVAHDVKTGVLISLGKAQTKKTRET
jgi:hypothetical protein